MKIKAFTLMHLVLVLAMMLMLMGALSARAQTFDDWTDPTYGVGTPMVQSPPAINPYQLQQMEEQWRATERAQQLQQIEQRMFQNQMLQQMQRMNDLRERRDGWGYNNRPVACGLDSMTLYARPGC